MESPQADARCHKPVIPEVSDEDVASAVAAAVKSLHGSLLAGMPVHPVCIRAALESYRAQLIAQNSDSAPE